MKPPYKILIIIILFVIKPCFLSAQPELQINCTDITKITYDNYQTKNKYFETHRNGAAHNLPFSLTIINLSFGSATTVDVKIKEKDEFGGSYVYTTRTTTDSTGTRIFIPTIDPFALNLSGIYEVELFSTSGALLFKVLDNYLFFEKAKTIRISGTSTIFTLHYTDAFFKATLTSSAVTQTTFLNELENAIKAAWKMEVIDFDLGTPNTNSNYDIYLHCAYDLINIQPFYHASNWYPSRTDPYDTDKNTFIDTKLFQAMNTSIITQQDLLYILFSHEFYHSIQWSHMSFNGLIIPPGSTPTLEVAKREWLVEGQAEALKTVFMDYYNTAGNNANYKITSTTGSYEVFCRNFITNALSNNYAYKNLHTLSYENGMFWRHMYEDVLDNAATDKDRLAFFRESCIAYNAANSSVLSDIKTFMDDQILNNHTLYSSYREALESFAENVYFH